MQATVTIKTQENPQTKRNFLQHQLVPPSLGRVKRCLKFQDIFSPMTEDG